MTKNRCAESVAVVAGLILLLAAPGQASTQIAKPPTVTPPNAASPAAQPNGNATLENDFAGLSYTDEQKTEIDKIHQDAASRKAIVAKDTQLTPAQKDAMITGYTRIEYGEIFSVLTPVQQKQVRQKMAAHRAADQAAQRKQSPGN